MKKHRVGKIVMFFAMLVLLVLPGTVKNVCAEEDSLRVTIRAGEGLGPQTLALIAEFPDYWGGSYEFYRGTKDPAAGGKLKLIDTISSIGNRWSSSGVLWYTYGNKQKILLMSEDTDLSGEMILGDQGLSLGKIYYYQIILKDDDGETVAESNVFSCQTVLAAPEILRGYASGSKSARLVWQKSDQAKGYKIYRATGKKWKCIRTVNSAKTDTFTDNSVKSGTTYKYKIRAFCKIGKKTAYSAYSQALTIKLKTPTVKGEYSSGSVYGPSLSSSKLTEVRRVVQSFKDNYVKKDMSDYDKVLTAFNYIRANCDYAWRGWQYNGANTAWGALVYGEAQCSGYARGMKALCDAIGVQCRYVHADSKASNPSHQWNMVKVDGKWYILDAQGGFFLVGSKTYQGMVGMHWSTSGLPACSREDHARGGFVSSEM